MKEDGNKGKIPSPRSLELLAPAADKNVAREAILHGADAVYIGGPSHGARSKASNSIQDIRDTVEFAHRYRVRVYVTVNTIVFENELREVEDLCWELYRVGVDALIVQDMSLLCMNLPPIALHASTQCDTRTVAKARFLEDVGFSQIVLARELSVEEVREITSSVAVPVECFIHGALCVSYSGRCAASCATLGRSANRGECAQICRLPFTLRNGRGEIIEKDKYLLSLRDFNAYDSLEQLVFAGVSSFKIEGRMKDSSYVKNVTAFYRQELDRIIASRPDEFSRSSCGDSEIAFTPRLDKSFNRGFTDYFLKGRRPVSMASLLSPKSMGEVIKDVRQLNNGDGISFFNAFGEYEGVSVNRVEGDRIVGSRPFRLPKDAVIHRTSDLRWQQTLAKATAMRTLWLDVELDASGVSASDERGVEVRIPLDTEILEARKPMDPRPVFAKLGNTVYRIREFVNRLPEDAFIPASQLTALRRRLVDALEDANQATYPYEYRKPENLYEGRAAEYPDQELDARDNVANSLAEAFYREHGVTSMVPAMELGEKTETVMTTRYCLRRELGCCLKDKKVNPGKRERFRPPLTLTTGPHRFRLDFDCRNCEMNVVKL